jgi:hypothetical protein
VLLASRKATHEQGATGDRWQLNGLPAIRGSVPDRSLGTAVGEIIANKTEKFLIPSGSTDVTVSLDLHKVKLPPNLQIVGSKPPKIIVRLTGPATNLKIPESLHHVRAIRVEPESLRRHEGSHRRHQLSSRY